MIDQPFAGAMRRLQAIVSGPGDEPVDRQLLERYVSLRDEQAFELLVRRHGPMVLGICRRLLANSHDADDAFQATFIVLARKAGSSGWHDSIAGWLSAAAYRIALKARTASQRRSARESDMPDLPSTDSSNHNDLKRVLDEEVQHLPEKYRLPVVLCYLEGKTNEEAARDLRCLGGTLKMRLSRARDLLRTRLGRRGVVVPAGCAALFETASLSAAVSPTLLSITLKGATQATFGRAGHAGAASAPVAALVEGAMRDMYWTKFKLLAALCVILGGVGTGIGYQAARPAGSPHAAKETTQVARAVPVDLGDVYRPPEPVDKRAETRAALDLKLDEFEIAKETSLRDALDLLAHETGLTFSIDVASFKLENILEPGQQPSGFSKKKDVKIEVILRYILAPLNAYFRIDADGSIVVVAVAQAVPQLWNAPVTIEFREKPLDEALQELSRLTDLDLVLDKVRAGDRAKTKITASLHASGLVDAVKLLANMAGLRMTFFSQRTLYVTSLQNATVIDSDVGRPEAGDEFFQALRQAEKPPKVVNKTAPTRAALDKNLNRTVGFVKDTPLTEALKVFEKESGLTIVFETAAFLDELGREITIRVQQYEGKKGTPIKTVLHDILSRADADKDLDYHVEVDGRIFVGSDSYLLTRRLYWPVSADFREKPLDEALEELARLTAADVVLDTRRAGGKAKTKITAKLHETKLAAAVRMLANMAGLRMVVSGRTLYVTTPENADEIDADDWVMTDELFQRVADKPLKTVLTLGNLAKTLAEIEVARDTALDKCLKFLEKESGLTFRIDGKSFDAESIWEPNNLQVALSKRKDATLKTVLHDLLSPVNADYIVAADGAIVVVPSSQMLRLQLRKKVLTELTEKPLDEALKELASLTAVEITLDPKLTGDKCKTKITIVSEFLPLGKAVRQAAYQAGLKMVVVGHKLLVTTPENARKIEDAENAKKTGK